ncbi:MAG: hypothetical protein ABR955_08605 [Verrucomicrobiota bacterium]
MPTITALALEANTESAAIMAKADIKVLIVFIVVFILRLLFFYIFAAFVQRPKLNFFKIQIKGGFVNSYFPGNLEQKREQQSPWFYTCVRRPASRSLQYLHQYEQKRNCE